MSGKKVLIIEDEAGIRMTLEDRLVAEGYEVESRADGVKGEEAAVEGRFDLILLDLMLPERDGLAVCKNLREAGMETPILMLTARGTNLDVVIGLRQGADDYLAKPFDTSVLLARMEALLRRAPKTDAASEASAFRFGPFVLDRTKGELLLKNETVPLSAQEYRLLDFLCARAGRVISRDQILDEVWGYDSETTTRTVDVHVAKLRGRLGESEFPKHIRTIRGRGYKFVQ
jgi:two-component system, OmpR family, alkaline phosphatase synthesis response regulator PhoP